MDAASTVVVGHLSAARDELVAERDRIDIAIRRVDDMLADYAVQPSAILPDKLAPASAPAPRRRSESNDAPSVMRNVILRFLTDAVGGSSQVLRAGDITKPLSRDHGWGESSVRSLLSKMADEGAIYRPERGRYGLPKTPGDTADTVPPGSVTTERQGGDGHAAGPDVVSVPDHDPTLGRRDDRDQDRETAPAVAIDF